MRLVYRVRAGKHDPESNAVKRSVRCEGGVYALCMRDTTKYEGAGGATILQNVAKGVRRLALRCAQNALRRRRCGDLRAVRGRLSARATRGLDTMGAT